MRINFYNQMFGCNGRSLTELLYVHLMHATQNYKPLERLQNLKKTVITATQNNPDVVGISEILGDGQREQLKEELKKHGFSYFHTGIGHGLGKKYNGNMESIIATKEQSECFYAPLFFAPSRSGFGGGVVGIFLPLKNLFILQVHLPLARIYRRTRASFNKQLKIIMNRVEDMIKKNPALQMIMMGDFNMSYRMLRKTDKRFDRYLKKISFVGPTCTTSAFIRYFYKKDIDHMFGYNIEAQTSGFLEGASDHRLIWVDV